MGSSTCQVRRVTKRLLWSRSIAYRTEVDTLLGFRKSGYQAYKQVESGRCVVGKVVLATAREWRWTDSTVDQTLR